VIQKRRQAFNIFILTILLMVLIGIQTTFWFNWIGAGPTPQLWLNLILYLILYRPALSAFFISYWMGYIIAIFSAIPIGTIWPMFFVLVAIGSFLRRRFFWPSTRYFILSSLLISIGFQYGFYFLSHFVEPNPAPFAFFPRLIEVFMTTLVAGPQYWLFKWIDRLTFGEIPERAFEGSESEAT
jgi:hypothetical protein